MVYSGYGALCHCRDAVDLAGRAVTKMTTQAPDVRDLFQSALSKAHQGMLVMMPTQKKPIMRALEIVTAGNVSKRIIDGERAGLEVNDGEKTYTFPKGSTSQCTCDKAGADNQCLHWLSMRLFEQAQHYVDIELAKHERSEIALRGNGNIPEPHTELGEITMEENTEHADGNEAQSDTPEIVEGNAGTYMQYHDRVNHDPHSITIKGVTSMGYEFMPCLRGHDLDGLLADVTKILRWMQEHKINGTHGMNQKVPTSAPQAEEKPPATQAPPPAFYITAPPAPKETPEGWCSEHSLQMKLNTNATGSWWSHKMADGSWCKGKAKKG